MKIHRSCFFSVTENGFAVKNEASLLPEDAIHDGKPSSFQIQNVNPLTQADRVTYFKGYTQALLDAINLDDVPVQSYFAWSKPDIVHFTRFLWLTRLESRSFR